MSKKMMFQIPQDTRLVCVEYQSKGVTYGATIPNPRSNDGLQVAMLARHVAMSQVKRVNGVIEHSPRP